MAAELDISDDLARALLLTNHWDRQAVLDALESDKDYVLNTFKFDPKEAQAKRCGLKQDESMECGVCFDEVENEEDMMTIGECGHRACRECVTDYCKAKLAMANDCIYTRCVACKFTIPEKVFKQTLSEDEFARY